MNTVLRRKVIIPMFYSLEVTGGTLADRRWKMKEMIQDICKTGSREMFGAGTAPSGVTVGYYYVRRKKSPAGPSRDEK
jgi:hypothetical protein